MIYPREKLKNFLITKTSFLGSEFFQKELEKGTNIWIIDDKSLLLHPSRRPWFCSVLWRIFQTELSRLLRNCKIWVGGREWKLLRVTVAQTSYIVMKLANFSSQTALSSRKILFFLERKAQDSGISKNPALIASL